MYLAQANTLINICPLSRFSILANLVHFEVTQPTMVTQTYIPNTQGLLKTVDLKPAWDRVRGWFRLHSENLPQKTK